MQTLTIKTLLGDISNGYYNISSNWRFWSEVRPLMLDLEAFVFIRAHNWDGKNQRVEVGEARTRSAHESFEVL